jgi:hypothetical protein
MRQAQLAGGVLALTMAAVLVAIPAASAASTSSAAREVQEVSPGKRYSTERLGLNRASTRSFAAAAADTPPVGTVRQWLALDDFQGTLYRKDYTLRGVGDFIEVWVANDLPFPAGDCRFQVANSTEITDAQVGYLIREFDDNIYPKETSVFSTPPDRDGSNAALPPDGNGGDYTGAGNRTVVLIDNVRDANFYDFPAAPTSIDGFFSAQLNELFDRNVITLDAFDWAHRTGDNPPDEPTDDPCTSRPARPNLYEARLANEWQQLLHYYTDPFETTWVNEGLSDFAETLTGYVDSTATVFERGADSRLYCFQGFGIVQTAFNRDPRDCGGPQNSLNLWDEGDSPNDVLADHGHAYSLMLFLFDRYGAGVITRLHNDGAVQGLDSLDAALEEAGEPDMYEVIHDHQSAVLLDKLVDTSRALVLGVPKRRVTSPSLDSAINLANPNINDDPGAAPNGADYVPLQDADGTVLRGRDMRSLTFAGAENLPPAPLTWSVVTDDPDRPSDPVLWSGNANNLDASAVTEVTVPSADPTLRLVAKYGAELGYDYGYVQVSTDRGATYTSVAGDKTVAAPLGPGLNGSTQGFEPHTFDLSAYAGQTVLLAFRYVSDGGVNEGGLRVDDVTVGGTSVSDGSSLEPFGSPTEIRPIPVHNWNVRLVGFTEVNGVPVVLQVESDGRDSIHLGRRELKVARPFQQVVAIVAYDEPTGQRSEYAPYTLEVNGVVQPGGTPGT